MVDYPPAVPPANRTDQTLSATQHAQDHNTDANALASIVQILGPDPAGPYADLTARLADRQGLYQVTNVEDFGAKGDGTTDDTAALQAAATAAGQVGGTLFLPPGIYGITAPITLPPFITIQGPGGTSLYPNFSTDYNTASPSWGTKTATIQRINGTHGPIFAGGTNCEFVGLVVRSVPTPTSADLVFANGPSHFRFDRCVVQNMYAVVHDNSAAWGAGNITRCQFTGNQYVFWGIQVDAKYEGNTFTSTAIDAIRLTTGSGYNSIFGNRFEFGTGYGVAVETSARNNSVVGNTFDAHVGAGVAALQCADPNAFVGNTFWRNGRGMAGDYTDCHVYLFASSNQNFTGNIYRYGQPDGGTSWTGPAAIIGVESCASTKNKFVGEDMRLGSKTSLIAKDRYGTSVNCLDIDVVSLPSGAAAGSTTDDIATSLVALSPLLVTTTTVLIHENRKVNTYVGVPKIRLRGAPSVAPTITNGSGSLNNLGGADNINYGGLTYTIVDGLPHATAIPDLYKANGGWPAGKKIYKAAPAAGDFIGWVKTADGSPDTWKTFGAISA